MFLGKFFQYVACWTENFVKWYNIPMFHRPPLKSVSYFRNFVFGVEDSLVSTIGLLSGIAIASVPREVIIATGIVLIFVEAFSMATGSFLSEYSAEEYEHGTESLRKTNIISAAIMFCSYFVSGFIPLSAYLFLPVSQAFALSIALSATALFALGMVGAKISGTGLFKNGLRTVCIGGVAIIIGVLAGTILQF
jgi:VIT1/CCC1 family predicted Fe2+/Mn2+ transporter